MRKLGILVAVLTALTLTAGIALAGNPHFVGQSTATLSADSLSLTVTGKLAGLGNEAQVDVQVTADVACVNPGSKRPKAANKQSVGAAGQFPVQNGKANFSLTATATFQPSCSPPMTLVWSNIVVTDTTHGISQTIPSP